MNNQWNRLIYKMWSPIYDLIFHRGRFREAREKLFRNIDLKSQQKILLVGVGTGADLEYLNHYGAELTAIDLSPDMLEKAKLKFNNSSVRFIEMDAQHLEFEDESFDLVVASLILSVVPDSQRCFHEILRVTQKKGQILIFDKFAPQHGGLSLGKRLLRPVIALLGTDIGVSFERMIEEYQERLEVLSDQPLLFGGMYRKILLCKNGD